MPSPTGTRLGPVGVTPRGCFYWEAKMAGGIQRFRKGRPCPVCEGYDSLPKGQGIRCSGFMSEDGRYAHCSREERADRLQANKAGLFAHFLAGPCRCGVTHGPIAVSNGGGGRHREQARVIKTTRFEIADAAGKVVAVHVRKDLEGGDKRVTWERPDGQQGLDGVPMASLPLYGLSRLLKADPSLPTILVEGEAKADALQALAGSIAVVVGTVTGAAVTPSDDSLRPLVARMGSLWSDHDNEGRSHMERIAAALVRLGASTPRMIEWAGAHEKGDDAADFVQRGGTLDELRGMIEVARPWVASAGFGEEAGPRARVVRLSAVETETIRWLWAGHIPLGKLTILDGNPGLGKSFLTLDLASRVSTGRDMPDGSPIAQGAVVLMSCEDGVADTIRPRLEAAGGDLDRITAITAIGDGGDSRLPSVPKDIHLLEVEIRKVGAVLAMIDPLMAYLGEDIDAHRDQDVRRALAELAGLAERTGAAIIVVRHLNKTASTDPIMRGGGSIGIIAAARAGFLVGRDPDDPTRRVLACTKMNIASEPPSLIYAIPKTDGTPRIVWLGESPHDARALLAQPGTPEERGVLGDACAFLRDALLNGPVDYKALLADARKAGISSHSLDRAKGALGIRSVKLGFKGGWVWALPPSHESGGLRQNGQEMHKNGTFPEEHQDRTWQPSANPPLDTKETPSPRRSPKMGAVDGDYRRVEPLVGKRVSTTQGLGLLHQVLPEIARIELDSTPGRTIDVPLADILGLAGENEAGGEGW